MNNQIVTTEQEQLTTKDTLIKIQKFLKILNQEPENIQVNKYADNSKYVPISTIEAQLDRLFFGSWSTKEFKWQIVGNEVVGSIILEAINFVSGKLIIRTGAAAVPIRQSKGAKIEDIGAKIKNALVMDFPHLYAQCLKSAAKSLGTWFGRNLNRDYIEEYEPMISEIKKPKKKITDKEFDKYLQNSDDYVEKYLDRFEFTEGQKSIIDKRMKGGQ